MDKFIRIKDVAKIELALADVQRLARVRCIDVSDIIAQVSAVEEKLGKLLYKKDWPDLRISVDVHAQSFPGAYKGIPESTSFLLTYTSSGWRVSHIQRARTVTHVHTLYGIADKKEKLVEFLSAKF